MNEQQQAQPRLLEAPEETPAPSAQGAVNPDDYRVLSVPEPLATLVMLGVKRICTTPRWTRHRGPTLLYSPGLGRLPVKRIPHEATIPIEGREMHRQAVIGRVNITLAAPTEGLNPAFEHHGLTPPELALDDFGPDRFALYLADPQWLAEPVPTTGRGQLWKPDQHTLAQVLRQLH